MIAYLSNFDAGAAIWIVSDPRPEHIQAITWLNESSSGEFYLIKLEAIRIGDSEPAPIFTTIVGPSEEARLVGETKKEIAQRYQIRLDFWKQFLERCQSKLPLFNSISPTKSNWLGAGAGRSLISYNFVINRFDSRVELFLDNKDQLINLENIDTLLIHKKEIEEIVGKKLDWLRRDDRQSSKVEFNIERGHTDDDWDSLQEKMIEVMVKFEEAFKPYIPKLK